MASGYAEIASGHSIAKRNSVIEQRRQRAEKRAYKERHAGPVSARSRSSDPLLIFSHAAAKNVTIVGKRRPGLAWTESQAGG